MFALPGPSDLPFPTLGQQESLGWCRLHLIPLVLPKTHLWGCPPVSRRLCCTANLQVPCTGVVPGQTAPVGEVRSSIHHCVEGIGTGGFGVAL